MIRYRPFLNTDPPRIAELWCQQPPMRSLVQPMTGDLLELRVFSKPYFDRQGLIVAEDDDQRLAGFAHAGFAVGADGHSLDPELGVICLVMTAHRDDSEQIWAELQTRSEQYLIDRGAKRLQAGCAFPANPFYLGLYGDSPSPGIMTSDHTQLDRFRSAGYEPSSTQVVMQRPMAGFRPVIDRNQMTLRRKYNVVREVDPAASTWWDACTIGLTDRTRHRLTPKSSGDPCGGITFWDMDCISASRGVRTMGIIEFFIPKHLRGQGLGTFLAGESLRYMHEQGMAVAEVQLPAEHPAAAALFRKLGFTEVDSGCVLVRRL